MVSYSACEAASLSAAIGGFNFSIVIFFLNDSSAGPLIISQGSTFLEINPLLVIKQALRITFLHSRKFPGQL